MNGLGELLRKQWTSLLGALFVLIACIYGFKYTVDQGWISDPLKIAVGLLAGGALSVAGFGIVSLRTAWKTIGEIVAGLGVSLLYVTFAFAGIYFALWDAQAVFWCMTAVTLAAGILSYRLDARIVMNIGLLGALVSPLVLRPDTDQIFTLFLYLLVVNAVYFTLSFYKGWLELRLLAFAGTWLLYTVYFVHVQPSTEGLWSLPIRYALAAYGFYVIALTVFSWRDNSRFVGANLYIGIANAIVFGMWSTAILDGTLPYYYPLAMMGVLYLVLSEVMRRLAGTSDAAVLVHFFGGLFLLVLAASQMGRGMDIKPMLNTYLWLAVSIGLLAAGRWSKRDAFSAAAICIWFMVGCYWYDTSWTTPRGEWFGMYIPFMSWGAAAWMLLAATGFYCSRQLDFKTLTKELNSIVQRLIAILSHLIVGGLLTVQISNMFDEYRLDFSLSLTLSVSWGIYALLLFLWGAYCRQRMFRWFGSVVLVGVALKTLFFDLYGEETIYKIIALFVLGLISFSISVINARWQRREQPAAASLPVVEAGEPPLTQTEEKAE